jgi:hypothetical protein
MLEKRHFAVSFAYPWAYHAVMLAITTYHAQVQHVAERTLDHSLRELPHPVLWGWMAMEFNTLGR